MDIQCYNCGYEYTDKYARVQPISDSILQLLVGINRMEVMTQSKKFILNDETDTVYCPLCSSINNSKNKQENK